MKEILAVCNSVLLILKLKAEDFYMRKKDFL